MIALSVGDLISALLAGYLVRLYQPQTLLLSYTSASGIAAFLLLFLVDAEEPGILV